MTRLIPAIFMICCLSIVTASQTASPPSSSAETPRSDDLLSTLKGISERIEVLRGQKFLDPPRAVRAPDEMRGVAVEIRASRVLDRERLAARGRAWSDLGLGGPASPSMLLNSLAADLGGVGFDASENRLLVSPDLLTSEDYSPQEGELNDPSTILMLTGVRKDEPLVSHLLMHVRQRERAGADYLKRSTDRLLASAAWAEGEANLLALRYLFEGMGLADDVIELNLDPGDFLDGSLVSIDLGRLPAAEASMVSFAYLEGFAQAALAYDEGGWTALDRAMTLRRTTRDLLHPELKSLPDALLEDPQAVAEGFVLADEDSLGEQGVVTLVSTVTGKDNLGLLAGDGWADDRLFRWEPDRGDPTDGITEWLTLWISEEEAADFEYAFGRTLGARFPGRPLESDVPGQRSLSTPKQLFRIIHEGTRVRVLITPAGAESTSEPSDHPLQRD